MEWWLTLLIGAAGTLVGLVVKTLYDFLVEGGKKAIKERKEHDKRIEEDLELLKKGMQVDLRYNLEEIYEKAESQGWCSKDSKIQFEGMYQSYHALGKNGVMDGKRHFIINLPEHPENKE